MKCNGNGENECLLIFASNITECDLTRGGALHFLDMISQNTEDTHSEIIDKALKAYSEPMRFKANAEGEKNKDSYLYLLAANPQCCELELLRDALEAYWMNL